MTQDDSIGYAVYATMVERTQPAPGAALAMLGAVSRARTRRRRRRAVVLLAATTVAVAAIGSLTLAGQSGQPSDHSVAAEGSSMGRQQWQIAVNAAVDDELARAESSDSFVGSRFNYDDRTVKLYGVGDPPGPAQELIDNPPPAVTEVSWIAVPFVKSELRSAARRALARIPGATSSGWNADFRSIYVTVPEASANEQKNALAVAKSLGPVPVSVRFDSGSIEGAVGSGG